MEKANNIRSSVYLSLTAVIWGVAFVFQSMGNDYMEPFTFTSSRYLLGCLVLVPVILIKIFHPRFLADSDEIPVKKVPVRLTVTAGVLCGLALGAASMFQQYGVTLPHIDDVDIGALSGKGRIRCAFQQKVGDRAAVQQNIPQTGHGCQQDDDQQQKQKTFDFRGNSFHRRPPFFLPVLPPGLPGHDRPGRDFRRSAWLR